jgi:hypothetical protein
MHSKQTVQLVSFLHECTIVGQTENRCRTRFPGGSSILVLVVVSTVALLSVSLSLEREKFLFLGGGCSWPYGMKFAQS